MRGSKTAILGTISGLAVFAAIVTGGAGLASAAPASPATHPTASAQPGCDHPAWQQWSVNGSNQVKAVYQGTTYTYTVKFRQLGTCIGGKLTDPAYPTTGPIVGAAIANHVIFSFMYPKGSAQGTRTFDGTVSSSGAVSGTWSETGSEGATGTFTLATNAHTY